MSGYHHAQPEQPDPAWDIHLADRGSCPNIGNHICSGRSRRCLRRVDPNLFLRIDVAARGLNAGSASGTPILHWARAPCSHGSSSALGRTPISYIARLVGVSFWCRFRSALTDVFCGLLLGDSLWERLWGPRSTSQYDAWRWWHHWLKIHNPFPVSNAYALSNILWIPINWVENITNYWNQDVWNFDVIYCTGYFIKLGHLHSLWGQRRHRLTLSQPSSPCSCKPL